MNTLETQIDDKLARLPRSLQRKIGGGGRNYVADPATLVSNFLVDSMRHCNGGRAVDAGLWLKQHCKKGGKLFVTLSGAASSFQIGVTLSQLIMAGHVGAVSCTGACMEESLYRLVAHDAFLHIPDYQELTRREELALDHAGFRRITDTFLPEDESVRVVFDDLLALWREAEEKGERRLWHEYFFELFERDIVQKLAKGKLEECWLYQAWLHKIPVVVGGWADSTMGNIFTHACYNGDHEILSLYKLEGGPISMDVVLPDVAYMHRLAEWFLDQTKGKKNRKKFAFLQLGGGIAADFPICVVPHLKKDFLHDLTIPEQEAIVATWAAFVEIHLTPMSAGSYSGAGFKEKITWGKFTVDAFGMQIFADFTMAFPLIAALILGL